MTTNNKEFERIITAFKMWCTKEGFALYQGHDTTQRVDIDEISTDFKKYSTDLDGFFNMLINVREDWEFYDTTKQDREFDCDSEYNIDWFVEGMSEIYNTKEA
tara:strand:+ start:83 stop:391 length:309 start_codon:yes stop_codon:yes gene_type:complete